MFARQRLHLGRVAPHEQRIGHEARPVPERDAALLANLENRADEMLVHAHAAGDAVHDDADAPLAHCSAISFICRQSGSARLA
jgi:hypothetical protein